MKVAAFSSRGELVPDALTIELWKTHIQRCVETNQFNPEVDNLILDGIPRNPTQASLLAEAVQVKALFHLECSNRSELAARLGRRAVRENRLDDAAEDVIRHRLEVFETVSKPLLDFYENHLVHSIDSQQKPAEVLCEILNRVRKIV